MKALIEIFPFELRSSKNTMYTIGKIHLKSAFFVWRLSLIEKNALTIKQIK